jgi:hypothetical protein
VGRTELLRAVWPRDFISFVLVIEVGSSKKSRCYLDSVVYIVVLLVPGLMEVCRALIGPCSVASASFNAPPVQWSLMLWLFWFDLYG